MSVCVLANDVSISLSNVIQFFPLSSLDRRFIYQRRVATHHRFFSRLKVPLCVRDDERSFYVRKIKLCPAAGHG